VKIVYPSQQWVIIGCELVQLGVSHDNHLDLFHIYKLLIKESGRQLTKGLMLLHGAGIYNRYDALFSEVFENCFARLLTVKEDVARMIGADENDAEILCVEVNVDVEEELLGDAWNANGRPCLSVLHRGVGIDVVQQDSYISYKELRVMTVYYLEASCLLFGWDL